jgi:hypothetical protein
MIVATDWLATMTCECGTAVMTIAPGSEHEAHGDLFVVQRGEPMRGWCQECAVRHGWLRDAA